MANEEKSPTELLLERKMRRDEGVRFAQFMGSDFYKQDFLPLLGRQGTNGLIQSNQQLADKGGTHAMLAASISWYFAYDHLPRLLAEIANQAKIDVTDEPAQDDGPDVTQ